MEEADSSSSAISVRTSIKPTNLRRAGRLRHAWIARRRQRRSCTCSARAALAAARVRFRHDK